MKLLLTVQAKIKTATQKDVDSVLRTLPNSMTEERILLDAAKLNDFTQKLQSHINSKLSTQPNQTLSTSVNNINSEPGKSTLPVTLGADLESMTIDEIVKYQKTQDELVEKQKLIADVRAKKQELIDLQEQNLSVTLENESAEASYKLRLESQPQLLALSIDNAKTLQAEIMEREVKALTGMGQAKRETPTSFEMLEVGAKKSQRLGQNRLNIILNSTEELVPTMRLTGSNEKTTMEPVTIDM